MPYPSGTQAFRQGVHSALPLTSGIVPFGLITGVTAIGMGLSPADAIGMTLLFYSGSAQMVVMQLMQSAALPVTMVVTALVINLRFLMYSASLAPHLGQLPRHRKWPMAYMLSDQSFALCTLKMGSGGLGQYAYPYYAGTAITMFFGWNLSVLAGMYLGASIPEDWSLGFAIPLSFLALLIPGIRNAATLGAALTGGVLAVLAANLPYNLGLLTGALGGIIAGLAIESWQKQQTGPEANTEQEAS
ncbi:AzlC family ABC transporter permease [Pseudomonas sp. 5FOS]|uniref:AzlC family ABC transporter permease n=1 Tax=unclassified Pseudomonas TaxID=196821 RepID=UPI001F166A07|nr:MULTISPECIES: AzlC family ABC transporter permease [unclassified Pseudomonas]MCE5987814.1 AzlC family ABC transporter permease [Pseudomonas sp. LM20]MCE5991092.1 AzlC family ABC transporter permease [Pseudomonas sp. KCA11]